MKATLTSICLSITGVASNIPPISAGIVWGSSLGDKVKFETVIQKYNKYRKQCQKDQQTINSFDELYRETFNINLSLKTNMNLYLLFF